jgi:hypothetical protein
LAASEGIGHGQAPVEAPKQGHAEVLLQRFDLMADRGLGDEKLFRGLGEGEVARRGLEGAQGIQGWQSPRHVE